MAKMILTLNDAVLQEVELSKERITIGRAPHNDLVIDNRAVSAEHAVIVTLNDDSFLEDLNSTNGTQVNGQPIKKHFLREDDVIELAQYQLRYLRSAHEKNSHFCNIGDMDNVSTILGKQASIRVLNGPNAGKVTVISKALTTIGHPDSLVAVIIKRSTTYFIAHVKGAAETTLVNEQSIGLTGLELVDGDVIRLEGVQMRFILG